MTGGNKPQGFGAAGRVPHQDASPGQAASRPGCLGRMRPPWSSPGCSAQRRVSTLPTRVSPHSRPPLSARDPRMRRGDCRGHTRSF